MGHSTSKAFAWSAIDQVGRQGIRFALSIVLARLLLPSEYGLMGMLIVFLMLAQGFADSGLSAGLIQRQSISEDDETSVFVLNIAAGTVLAIALCCLSPLVAVFYRQPILRPLLCVCSLGVFISSFGIVHTALLTREVDFRTQAIITLIATVSGGALGIGMALRGWGVWSLAGQSLALATVNVIMLWILRPWRPRGRFSWASIRTLWPFSSKLLASGLLSTMFDNLYTLVIGKLYVPAELGFYTRASSLAMLPATSVTNMTQRVMFPVFSRMQDDTAKIRQGARRLIRLLGTFHFPMMAGLAAVAKPLVVCLLTAKWLPCVPYFRILCFAGMLYPLQVVNLDIMNALGRSDLFLKLEVVKKILIVVLLAATFWLGVGAMVASILANSVICLAINSYYNRRLIDYGWGEQMRDILPMIFVSSCMAAAVWLITLLNYQNSWALLGVQISAALVIYALFVWSLRNGPYFEPLEISLRVYRRLGLPAFAIKMVQSW